MSEHYQTLDAPHFDYRLVRVPGIEPHTFRGPLPDLSQPYFACIGGAQTFGRFCAKPFTELLAHRLGMPCLNLGLGGAGPRFAREPAVLHHLAAARFVIVQMFSGRSASNSRFDNSGGRNYGRVVGSNAWQRFEQFLRELMALGDHRLLQRTVRETRDDYAFDMLALAGALPPPKVLLWLSRRTPEYDVDWTHVHRVMGAYPQLIDRETTDRIRPGFDAYVECALGTGLPQPLWPADAPIDGTALVDGRLQNDYYPSPAMHAAAAERLLPVCAQLLAADPGGNGA